MLKRRKAWWHACRRDHALVIWHLIPLGFWPKRSERKGLWQATYKPLRLKTHFSALESHEILTRLSCKLPLDNSGMLKVFPLQTIGKESQFVCANFLGCRLVLL